MHILSGALVLAGMESGRRMGQILPEEGPQPSSIVTARDLLTRIKFFGAVLVAFGIDGLFLVTWLSLICCTHWLFGKVKTQFPTQVMVVEIGEWVAIIGLSVVCLAFIATDIKKTVRKIWRVMKDD
jgi:hypothetical protein